MASSKTKIKDPTEKQCDSWKFSLENVLRDPVGFERFRTFLENYETEKKQTQGEYTRYLDFWTDCHSYKESNKDLKNSKKDAQTIFELYLAPRAKKRIELAGDDDIIPKLKETIYKVNDDGKDTEDDDNYDNIISEVRGIFDLTLKNMRKHLDDGGCCMAYDKWKQQLKPEKKKRQGFSCRLM